MRPVQRCVMVVSLLLVSTSGLAEETGPLQMRGDAEITIEGDAVSRLHSVVSAYECAATPARITIAWRAGGTLRVGSAFLPVGWLELELVPAASYATGTGGIMALLQVSGAMEVDRDHWDIEQDHVGTFFARVLAEGGTMRVLLPIALVATETSVRRSAILTFQCSEDLTACSGPHMIFEGLLRRFERATDLGGLVGSPEALGDTGVSLEEQPVAPILPVERQDCCVEASTGKCKCKEPCGGCALFCHTCVVDECFSCEEAFLCNC